MYSISVGCQDVLYSEGKSAIVACGSRIFSDKMNVCEAGMPNQQSIDYNLIFSGKGKFRLNGVNCRMDFVEFIVWV